MTSIEAANPPPKSVVNKPIKAKSRKVQKLTPAPTQPAPLQRNKLVKSKSKGVQTSASTQPASKQWNMIIEPKAENNSQSSAPVPTKPAPMQGNMPVEKGVETPASIQWNKSFTFTPPLHNTVDIRSFMFHSPNVKDATISDIPKHAFNNTAKLSPKDSPGYNTKTDFPFKTAPKLVSKPEVELVCSKTESVLATEAATKGISVREAKLKMEPKMEDIPKMDSVSVSEAKKDSAANVGSTSTPVLVAKPVPTTISVPEVKELSVPKVDSVPVSEAKEDSAADVVSAPTPILVKDHVPELMAGSETQDIAKDSTLEQHSTQTVSLSNDTCGNDSVENNLQYSKTIIGAETGAKLEALEAKRAQLHTKRDIARLETMAEQKKAEEEFDTVVRKALEKKNAVIASNNARISAINSEIFVNEKEIDDAIEQADQLLRNSVHPRILMLLETRAALNGNKIASEKAGQ